jgi:hypothetical protein
MVTPRALLSRIVSKISRTSIVANPSEGSSSMSSQVRTINARPIESIC